MSESELKDFIIELQEENMELEHIVGLRQKRGLISKFDKEFDEEDKKKNPNRDYAGIIPDAEEVYKRYYELKDNWQELKDFLEEKWQESCYINNDKYRLWEELDMYKLNDEVEIIEEPKKIEKIDKILMINDLIPPYGENEYKAWKNIIIQQNKINELIDEINNLKEK